MITIDLPPPPSVNRTRRLDGPGKRAADQWVKRAHALVMASGFKRAEPVGRFELFITLSEQHTSCDLDNPVKAAIDYLRRIEVIKDDSPKHFRKLTVSWGEAPEGCRVVVVPIGIAPPIVRNPELAAIHARMQEARASIDLAIATVIEADKVRT